jgi:glucose-1-phosphate thymidylyltransferase
MRYKGIILAGGNGTRLHPITVAMSKQLLPIYDKPMIYYPLSVLMTANISEILVITKPEETHLFKSLLGDGSQFGMKIEYAEQPKPKGIAQGLLIAEKFLSDSPSVLILGDNIFYGSNLDSKIAEAMLINEGAYIFPYKVQDPSQYGVLKFGKQGDVSAILEKPKKAPSNLAVPGLYIFDETASTRAKSLSPSTRGELEITDLLNGYLNDGLLKYCALDRGTAWLDTGTPESLLEASMFVQTIEKRQGQKIACLEEIAFKNSWISRDQLIRYARAERTSNLAKYLLEVVKV